MPAGAAGCDASGSRRGVAGVWWLNVEPHGHLAGPTERLDWGRIKRDRATERDTERVIALRRLFVQSLGKGRIGLQQV